MAPRGRAHVRISRGAATRQPGPAPSEARLGCRTGPCVGAMAADLLGHGFAPFAPPANPTVWRSNPVVRSGSGSSGSGSGSGGLRVTLGCGFLGGQVQRLGAFCGPFQRSCHTPEKGQGQGQGPQQAGIKGEDWPNDRGNKARGAQCAVVRGSFVPCVSCLGRQYISSSSCGEGTARGLAGLCPSDLPNLVLYCHCPL